ncbi:secretory pathway Sec39 [Lophium mytilinum]|uniref:Secretory pathway Sec39 n=1 Tax=Lophium mytilinum TaxID=390894 RepID=A0A6A6RF72_9PEZI|nr:secretory pathway Sec39 [Lophium mytilinum]
MAEAARLSVPRIVLLAVQYATEANITALRTLTISRKDAFNPQLTLRIILSYLPESTEPTLYTTFVHETASRIYSEGQDNATPLDISPVADLSERIARKGVHKLHLLQLAHSSYTPDTPEDILTSFLVHRAHRIDAETGLLELVPQLIVPFLRHSEYLRTWFISSILPLLRYGYEYYPHSAIPTLQEFGQMRAPKVVDMFLSPTQKPVADKRTAPQTGRDLRGLVGPWMYGYNDRKRRRLNTGRRESSVADNQTSTVTQRTSSSPEEPVPESDEDWECLFAWFVHTATNDFPLVTGAIEDWDGPSDADLGGYDEGHQYLEEETQRRLEIRYAQSALASAYSVEANTPETIEGAHSLLVRLATLMDFEPPPGLATTVELLPKIDTASPILQETSATLFQKDVLLRADNPLTKPEVQTFCLLQMFVYSAYNFGGLSYNISIMNVAKMRFHKTDDEQFGTLQKVLHGLTTGPQKDDEQWSLVRDRLLWLWNWGIDVDENGALFGAGVFGKVERGVFEREILRAFLDTGRHTLAVKIYISATPYHRLSLEEIETVIITAAMAHYDNASNGNRTRGGMKKAADIISTFDKYFPNSSMFQRSKALISATHALSFYSLTLQHGVPFKPVMIRASLDPLTLLEKVLDQNPRSYTHLDDFISIGQNLVIATPSRVSGAAPDLVMDLTPTESSRRKNTAERRVIGMAIEAALAEDDFETAYSYVVNRLSPPNYFGTPSTPGTPATPMSPIGPLSPLTPTDSRRPSMDRRPSIAVDYLTSSRQKKDEDDLSWRAAFLAGRHRSSPMSGSYNSAGSTAPPILRRLEQRMELLSQALLLAPPANLPEVLGVWQECEEEMTTLLAQENEAELRFNDRADQKLPGAFTEAVAIQPRREVGRGAVEETPMGLFDVARGAAAAFSRSAFPLRGASVNTDSATGANRGDSGHARMSSDLGSEAGSFAGSDEGGRVRKRDMVASAVTGGLASGLGWVLGAKPVQDPDRD